MRPGEYRRSSRLEASHQGSIGSWRGFRFEGEQLLLVPDDSHVSAALPEAREVGVMRGEGVARLPAGNHEARTIEIGEIEDGAQPGPMHIIEGRAGRIVDP